jgi:uncharacterized protein (TIGR02145 family)
LNFQVITKPLRCMKLLMKLFIVPLVITLLSSCGQKKDEGSETSVSSESASPQPTDFKTVKIGTQEWTSENISFDQFADGSSIPQAKTKEEWRTAKDKRTPAWCYYEFNEENGRKYGKLYNRFAIFSPNGFAPKGWTLPKNEDWEALKTSLGEYSAPKIKSSEIWGPQEGNNESGFSALPGGKIEIYIGSASQDSVTFVGIGEHAAFWSATPDNPLEHYVQKETRGFEGKGYIQRVISSDGSGFSVRLLKAVPQQ